MMGLPSPPLPKGYAVGDRIVTNAVYARTHRRTPGPRYGLIVGGSRSTEGPVKVLLNDYKYPISLSLKVFDLVKCEN